MFTSDWSKSVILVEQSEGSPWILKNFATRTDFDDVALENNRLQQQRLKALNTNEVAMNDLCICYYERIYCFKVYTNVNG